ncbi:unnamed protein product [Arctogadus glacialis]
MNEEAFLIFLEHFIRHTNCSTDHPVPLIRGNNESYTSLKSVSEQQADRYPFNGDIFPDEDYAPSVVTDRANPEDEPSATAELPGPSHEPTHVTGRFGSRRATCHSAKSRALIK